MNSNLLVINKTYIVVDNYFLRNLKKLKMNIYAQNT